MSSDFCSEETGILRYSDEVWETKKQQPEIAAAIAASSEEQVRRAGSVLSIGVNRDGYYHSELFLEDIKNASTIVRENSGGERKAVFITDNSPIHNKKGDDSLNAKRMNVNSGGKQPFMEDGYHFQDGMKVSKIHGRMARGGHGQ
jgi:hypothetical protein